MLTTAGHTTACCVAVGDKLLEQVFNLKFMAKQLNRSAIKCEKDEKSERLKVKKAIEKGNTEGAKIYAQNAIRKKHEQLNYLKLASRLDAVVSRLDTQAKMSMVNRNMMAITKNLEKALAANNLEKVSAGCSRHACCSSNNGACKRHRAGLCSRCCIRLSNAVKEKVQGECRWATPNCYRVPVSDLACSPCGWKDSF